MCLRIMAGFHAGLLVACGFTIILSACEHPARRSGQFGSGGAAGTPGFTTTAGTGSPSAPTGGSSVGPSAGTGAPSRPVGPRDEVVPPSMSAGGGGGGSVMPPMAAKMSCGPGGPYSDQWSPGYKDDPAALTQAKATASSMTLPEKA